MQVAPNRLIENTERFFRCVYPELLLLLIAHINTKIRLESWGQQMGPTIPNSCLPIWSNRIEDSDIFSLSLHHIIQEC